MLVLPALISSMRVKGGKLHLRRAVGKRKAEEREETGWAAGKSGFFPTKNTRPTEPTPETRCTLTLVTGRPLLGSLWNLNVGWKAAPQGGTASTHRHRLCSQTEHTRYVYHFPNSPLSSLIRGLYGIVTAVVVIWLCAPSMHAGVCLQNAAGSRPSCGLRPTPLAATEGWPPSRIPRQICFSGFFKVKNLSISDHSGSWQKTKLSPNGASKGMLTKGLFMGCDQG